MSLSSSQLDAFAAVAKHGNFSRAADALFITQSALSQRILNLEQHLGETLIIREPQHIRLTEVGQKLLRYCRQKVSLENEFLQSVLMNNTSQLAGTIRVAGFSTITKSILVPLFADLLIDNPNLQFDLRSLEFAQMLPALESGEVDYVLTGQKIEKKGIIVKQIGQEYNVLVESNDRKSPNNMFLDHDESDATTINFLSKQPNPPLKWSRHYLDNIELIIEGVKHGIGRAVLPKHLINNLPDVKIVTDSISVASPIYLAYYHKVYESALDKIVLRLLKDISLK